MKKLILLITLLIMTTACRESVDPGHIGICKNENGFNNRAILSPGLHSCWGLYESMYELETKDSRQVIHIKVLAKDSLNMSFDVSMLVSINTENPELVRNMFSNIGTGSDKIIEVDEVFKTYAANLIDQEVRKVISRYETTDISNERAVIIDKIRSEVQLSLKDTVIKVKEITINNMDFPEVVTKAQEIKKTRQVEIATEEAQQKKKLIVAKNSLEIAEIQAAKQLLEAKAMADSNKILSNSITPEYLEYKRIEAMKEMAKKGDLIMMPYNSETKLDIKSKVFDIKVRDEIRSLTEK